EQQLIERLHLGPQRVVDLAPELYKGLPAALMRFAELQILAGLRKLQQEGSVEITGAGADERWCWRSSPSIGLGCSSALRCVGTSTPARKFGTLTRCASEDPRWLERALAGASGYCVISFPDRVVWRQASRGTTNSQQRTTDMLEVNRLVQEQRTRLQPLYQ